jgi:hypothetical protein
MSGSTYPTLSTTIPLYNILIDHMEDIISDELGDLIIESEELDTETESNNTENQWSLLIKESAKKCKTKLLEYYNKTNDSYLIAVILDPRLKVQYYQDHDWGETLINEIQKKSVY